MIDQDELLNILEKRYSSDNEGDYDHVGSASTMGIVVDTDDPLQQGRLRVFCPSLGDDPELLFNLPWSVYVSPFGGVINNNSYDREGQTSDGPVAYGMWNIPQLGANVAVGCFDGDLRKRFYWGCIFDQQQTHTLLNGRWVWSEGGKVDGPLTGNGNPIQPAYDNNKQAFGNDTSAPEYQTRIAEYTVTAVDANKSQLPNNSGNSGLDQQYDAISGAQQFPFNKDTVGSHGYDYTGFNEVPLKGSKVYGWCSPNLHSISMDDRPYNSRTKWKSAAGHQILMDDTNERIYIATAQGNSWVELDNNGNIDVYAKNRISFHSDSDINFDANGSIRLTAKQGIYGYAGDGNSLPKLTSAPIAGDIRFQSENDMSLISNNFRQLSFMDTIFEIGGKFCQSVGSTYNLQVDADIDILTNEGDLTITVSGNYNLNVLEKIQEFSIGGISSSTKGDVNYYSYYGTMNIGAQKDIVEKSISGNITMQAVGGNSGGTGSVSMKSPNSQMSVSDSGGSISTSGSMNMQTGGSMSVQSGSTPQQSQPFPEDQIPNPSCSVSTPVDITGYTGADLAARVAYNAGFTGQSLVVAVAIAGAESRYNPNAIGDTTLVNSKWGPSLGFWQCRTLVNPSAYSYPDTLRINPDLYDPQKNANAAYAFSKQGQNFGPWSTYMSKAYLNFVDTAITAINGMCGITPTPSIAPSVTPTPNLDGFEFESKRFDDLMKMEPILPLMASSGLKPSIYCTESSVYIQSIDDIYFVSSNQNMSITAYGDIKGTSDATVAKVNQLVTTIDSCCDSSLTTMSPMTPGAATVPQSQIPSQYFPYMNADSEQLMNLANFDIVGKTII